MNLDDRDLDALQAQLGYRFDESGLLDRALAHRSWVAEHGAVPSNERLEFLGDAVLGWVIADIVFRRFTEESEGALTELRKSVVNGQTLAEVAREIDIGPYILLGRGESNAGGSEKVSILADTLEAIIGAIYLDGGRSEAYEFIERRFADLIAASVGSLGRLDEKSALQELAARQNRPAPEYSFTAAGPDHDKTFTVTVAVGELTATGVGRSKKAAEQAAAGAAVAELHGQASDDIGEPG